MSVLTSKKPRVEKLTAHQRLAQIDVRIAEARAAARELDRHQQLAEQAAVNADQELIRAQGRHGAMQISDDEVAQVEKSYEAAKAEADRPWKRDLAVAQAKVAALEAERQAFLSDNAADLANEVTERAKAVQAKIIANNEQRGDLAAEINGVIAEWKRLGYTTSRFPLENLSMEWRREARLFDPGSIPLIVPEPRS